MCPSPLPTTKPPSPRRFRHLRCNRFGYDIDVNLSHAVEDELDHDDVLADDLSYLGSFQKEALVKKI